MQVQRYPTWTQLALFGIVGPPVGALAILSWGHISGQPPLPFDLRAWFVVAFLLAYLYSGLPALLTGLTAAIARALAAGPGLGARTFRFAVPLVVGPAASVLFSLGTIASEPDASFAAAGAAAAFVCTVVAEWLLRWRPNNSFKPNPLRGTT